MPKTSGLQTRLVALELLQSVLRRKIPMDQALADHKKLPDLLREDRGFVRLLLATVLRRLGQIDYLIAQCLERPLKKDATGVMDILRLGITQLVFVKTPAHAAIHTSVELCRAQKLAGFSGLVNAVLRRLQNDAATLLEQNDDASSNTPDWLWTSWVAAYGEDVAKAIGEAHLIEPPLDISVKSDPEKWAERLGATILPNGTLRSTTGGGVENRDGFESGEWWVQDLAASLPAQLLGDIRGKRVIDLCAAPGGKTAQLLSLGASVIAVDHSKQRLTRLKQNLDRLKLEAEVVCADAAEWQPAHPADFILLDAPCSATGTIRKHPDIPWLKSETDIARLAEAQKRILANAATMLAPGGVLVYAVCSLQPEEGPEAIAQFLSTNNSLQRQPILEADLPAFSDLINKNGDLRSLPCDFGDLGGMDGFYVARLRKNP